ncbi:putative SIT4 phosphatase-associated protein family [Helianthus anomalus]
MCSLLQDVYFDDESAEVVISSLRLGDDQESGSLFTNSNWFAFEEERVIPEQSTSTVASPSPNTDATTDGGGDDMVMSNENDKDLVDSATSEVPQSKQDLDDAAIGKATDQSTSTENDKPTEWIEWREAVEPESSSVIATESAGTSHAATDSLPNGVPEVSPSDDIATDPPNKAEVSLPSSATDKLEAVADSGGKTDVAVSPPE